MGLQRPRDDVTSMLRASQSIVKLMWKKGRLRRIGAIARGGAISRGLIPIAQEKVWPNNLPGHSGFHPFVQFFANRLEKSGGSGRLAQDIVAFTILKTVMSRVPPPLGQEGGGERFRLASGPG